MLVGPEQKRVSVEQPRQASSCPSSCSGTRVPPVGAPGGFVGPWLVLSCCHQAHQLFPSSCPQPREILSHFLSVRSIPRRLLEQKGPVLFDSVLGYFLPFWNEDSSKRQSNREEIKRVMRRNKKGFMITFPTHHVLAGCSFLPAQLPAANNSQSISSISPGLFVLPSPPAVAAHSQLCSAFPAPGACSRPGLPPPEGRSRLPSEASPDSATFIGETCHAHTASARRSNRCCLSQSLEPNYRRLQKLFINIYTHLNIFINVSGLDKSVYCYFSLRHNQVPFIQCSYNNHIFVLSCFLTNMDSSC